MIIETLVFRLVEGADEAAFVDADTRLQTDFAYQQPGLVRRTTARNAAGEWLVVDFWATAADADACDARWDHDPVVAAWLEFVDRSSIQARRFESLD